MTDVPQHVLDAAKAAFRTHQPGRVLLRRVDLNGAAEAPSGQARSLVFAGDDVCVQVDVSRDEGRPCVTVRLEPDADVVVELQHPDPTLSFVTRGRSLLQLEAEPRGLARLLITSDDEAATSRRWQTPWTHF